MSSAYYGQGLNSYNNRQPGSNYVTWKGTGSNSNPIGIGATNMRPFTNKDYGNVFPTGFGLPRPIKHYRKQRVIPIPSIYVNPLNTTQYLEETPSTLDVSKNNQSTETRLINYNLNRHVKSSKGASLGGGSGGTQWIHQLMDGPGQYTVKQNSSLPFSQIQPDCTTCQGGAVVVNYYPNKPYLTENPEANTVSPAFCCNEEKKAKRRVLPSNTNLPKNYYTRLQQYRQNRCETFEQRSFNFKTGPETLNKGKAGSPLALTNTYVGNCQANTELNSANNNSLFNQIINVMINKGILTTSQIQQYAEIQSQIFTPIEFFAYINTLPEASQISANNIYNLFLADPNNGSLTVDPLLCKLVVYKPSNYQFATEGAVFSSTQILKRNVTTIESNLAQQNIAIKKGFALGYEGQLNQSGQPAIPFIYKNKVQGCNAETQIRFQNKVSCVN